MTMKKNEEKNERKDEAQGKKMTKKKGNVERVKTSNIRRYAQHALKRNYLVIAGNVKKN